MAPAAEATEQPLPAQRPPLTPLAPLMSFEAPPAARLLSVECPSCPLSALVSGLQLHPSAPPDAPPCARAAPFVANDAAIGETSRMPPPLPPPPLPTFWPLMTAGDPPPAAFKVAELVPVPMVMVPEALISNAPPPAPAAPAPLPPVPPEHPPRNG